MLLGSAGPPQLTAALLDLAERGHLEIWYRHLDTGRPRAVSDVLFEQVPSRPGAPHAHDELTDAEAELLERVFSHGDCVAVDTLRRLAMRWPPRLVGQLAQKVEIEPAGQGNSRRVRGSVAVLVGVLGLIGMIGAVAIAALTLVDVAWAVGLALVSAVVAVSAERWFGRTRRTGRRGSNRSRTRATTLPSENVLAYRAELAQLAAGHTLRTPADYQDLFGPHHAWAIALEIAPDWLGLRLRQPDPWAGARSPFNSRSVSVRRARKIPVARRAASVRVVHRVPQPRHPQE